MLTIIIVINRKILRQFLLSLWCVEAINNKCELLTLRSTLKSFYNICHISI
jgi:hypothetical protein